MRIRNRISFAYLVQVNCCLNSQSGLFTHTLQAEGWFNTSE